MNHERGFSIHTPNGTVHKDDCIIEHDWDVQDSHIIHTIIITRKDTGEEVMRWPSMCVPKGIFAMAQANEVCHG